MERVVYRVSRMSCDSHVEPQPAGLARARVEVRF